jgi:hypothetical protein
MDIPAQPNPTIPSPAAPVPQIPAMPIKKSRKWLWISLVVIVLAAVSAALAYTQSLWPFVPPESVLSPIDSTTRIVASNWKNCTNTVYGYTFKYPAEWMVFKRGTGEFMPALCQDTVDLTLATSAAETGINSFSLEVDTQERLAGTVYAGAKTLDQYFQKNPSILQARPIFRESALDGERLVELADHSFLVFHNSTLFQFNVFGTVSDGTALQIFSTFRFTNPTAGWKTYSGTYQSSLFGFSFQIPSGLEAVAREEQNEDTTLLVSVGTPQEIQDIANLQGAGYRHFFSLSATRFDRSLTPAERANSTSCDGIPGSPRKTIIKVGGVDAVKCTTTDPSNPDYVAIFF